MDNVLIVLQIRKIISGMFQRTEILVFFFNSSFCQKSSSVLFSLVARSCYHNLKKEKIIITVAEKVLMSYRS